MIAQAEANGPTVRFDAAIAGAVSIREERDALTRRCVEADSLSALRDAFEASTPDSPVRSMRLLGVLEALAGSGGKVASRRLLARLGVDEAATLAEIAPSAWDAMVAGLAGSAP